MRPRSSVYVEILDLTKLEHIALRRYHTSNPPQQMKCVKKWGVVSTTSGMFAVSDEGLGGKNPIDDRNPLVVAFWPFWNGECGQIPYRLSVSFDTIPELCTGNVVNLSDFIRSFDDRLEANFELWNKRLSSLDFGPEGLGDAEEVEQFVNRKYNEIPVASPDPQDEPPANGEHFMCRNIDGDQSPGCFCCGGEYKFYHCLPGLVQCKDSGDRILQMFEVGVWLDYRPWAPHLVQIKIGACPDHLPMLKELRLRIQENDNIITNKIIDSVLNESI